MKTLITNYLFNAAGKTVSFVDYDSIDLEKILLITNVVDNIIIYNFANPNQKGVVSDNVLTLNYDTTLMSDSDELQIYYDDDMFPLSAKKFEAGGKILIGINPIELNFFIRTRVVTVSSSLENNGMIYIGDSNVTKEGANSFLFLLPGDTVTLEYDNMVQPLFVVASTTGQYIWKGAFQ